MHRVCLADGVDLASQDGKEYEDASFGNNSGVQNMQSDSPAQAVQAGHVAHDSGDAAPPGAAHAGGDSANGLLPAAVHGDGDGAGASSDGVQADRAKGDCPPPGDIRGDVRFCRDSGALPDGFLLSASTPLDDGMDEFLHAAMQKYHLTMTEINRIVSLLWEHWHASEVTQTAKSLCRDLLKLKSDTIARCGLPAR